MGGKKRGHHSNVQNPVGPLKRFPRPDCEGKIRAQKTGAPLSVNPPESSQPKRHPGKRGHMKEKPKSTIGGLAVGLKKTPGRLEL